jgi:hypothetical protein
MKNQKYMPWYSHGELGRNNGIGWGNKKVYGILVGKYFRNKPVRDGKLED